MSLTLAPPKGTGKGPGPGSRVIVARGVACPSMGYPLLSPNSCVQEGAAAADMPSGGTQWGVPAPYQGVCPASLAEGHPLQPPAGPPAPPLQGQQQLQQQQVAPPTGASYAPGLQATQQQQLVKPRSRVVGSSHGYYYYYGMGYGYGPYFYPGPDPGMALLGAYVMTDLYLTHDPALTSALSPGYVPYDTAALGGAFAAGPDAAAAALPGSVGDVAAAPQGLIGGDLAADVAASPDIAADLGSGLGSAAAGTTLELGSAASPSPDLGYSDAASAGQDYSAGTCGSAFEGGGGWGDGGGGGGWGDGGGGGG
ncbi:hypothetical protein QJQ45_013906 [Haematococcus lacustris]|nr:hypothetical protein QJQ45_013906 [Haematococcus lacustris]